MNLSYFDAEFITDQSLASAVNKLSAYRDHCALVGAEMNAGAAEYSLYHVRDEALHEALAAVQAARKGVRHVLLIGIGGSSLGLEAVYEVMAPEAKARLTVLDTITAANIATAIAAVAHIKKPAQLAVCVVSKSGGTTETLANAAIVLEQLEARFGAALYDRTFFIGDPNTAFMKQGKRLGATLIPMPAVVGGRYSVATTVGLVPMALLGLDVDRFIAGVSDASTAEFEEVVAENAARLFQYIQKGYRHHNFFAFEPRLAALGAWYRQLAAESLGKSETRQGKSLEKGMVPTISTPVELHSIGQLYLSGFPGVYTDFVTFDDDSLDFTVPTRGVAATLKGFTAQEIATAIYGGVIGAYQERKLPYRTTIFDEDILYSLGLFMGMRMREVMYVAELLDVNAFDQPNVELYKSKTKAILGLQ